MSKKNARNKAPSRQHRKTSDQRSIGPSKKKPRNKFTSASKSSRLPAKQDNTIRPFPVPRELRIEPYWQELNKVIDPEINLGVVDLGLIYDIKIKAGKCTITMSLTTPACPYAPMLLKQIEDRMRLYRDIKSVKIKIVWEPVWNQEFIDPDIRDLMMGF